MSTTILYMVALVGCIIALNGVAILVMLVDQATPQNIDIHYIGEDCTNAPIGFNSCSWANITSYLGLAIIVGYLIIMWRAL